MNELSTKAIAYLRGLGQRLEPMVHIGQAGLTDALIASVNQALDGHISAGQSVVDSRLGACPQQPVRKKFGWRPDDAEDCCIVWWSCVLRSPQRSSRCRFDCGVETVSNDVEVLIEQVGVDIQRHRRLGVAQHPLHRFDIRA